jgi:hypothetical protein
VVSIPRGDEDHVAATMPKLNAKARSAPVLDRLTFKTSRLAEFCSRRELVAQTGHRVQDWPLVILKES